MALSFIKVYFDFEERTEQLTEEEQGRLLLAMLRHAKGKEPPALTGNERFLFPIFKIDVEREMSAYDAKIRNGTKGGRPKTERNLKKPNETEKNLNKPKFEEQEQEQEQEKEQEKEQDKDQEHEQKQEQEQEPWLDPPTVDDVRIFAEKCGYDSFPAERFVDHYAGKNWTIRGEPLKSWKAMVRSWAASDIRKQGNNKPTNPALDYEQRDNEYYNNFKFLEL